MAEVERPGDAVEVEWLDSTGRSDWHEPPDAKGLLDNMTCLSSGYLVVDDEKGIIITQGVGALGNWLSSMAIPRVAIVSVTQLRRLAPAPASEPGEGQSCAHCDSPDGKRWHRLSCVEVRADGEEGRG